MSGQRELPWLAPESPPDSFPDPRHALARPNGLLAAGGDLSPQRLIAAYSRGIFPWFSEGEPVLWWCPDPRAVLVPGEFHCSRSLRRRLRSNRFRVSVDQRFGDVIRLCSSHRTHSGTWLTAGMIQAYIHLHSLGYAHSIEVWQDGCLAGGLYGLGMGGLFFGESMVSLQADASKIALCLLNRMALDNGIMLIDCQVPNDHLASLGSRLIPRQDFLAAVSSQVGTAPLHRLTPQAPMETSMLAVIRPDGGGIHP